MKKQEKQKTQIKIEKGKIYQCLDTSNDVTSSSYYIVKEVDEKKGEAKILIVDRTTRTKDILDNDEVIISFQPLDYVKAFDNEPVTLKIKHLEKLNLKEIK